MRIEFVIPGEPVGWQRAGENSRSGRHYTQDKTKNYERSAGWEYKKEAAKKGASGFLRPPLVVFISAYHRPPKSWTKKKREEAFGRLWIGKPDGDNIAKAVLDGLSGISFRDDAEVAVTVVQKRYTSRPEDDPRTEVTVMDEGGYIATNRRIREAIKKS